MLFQARYCDLVFFLPQSTPKSSSAKHTSPTHYQAPWAVLIPAHEALTRVETVLWAVLPILQGLAHHQDEALTRDQDLAHHQDEALTRVETDLWAILQDLAPTRVETDQYYHQDEALTRVETETDLWAILQDLAHHQDEALTTRVETDLWDPFFKIWLTIKTKLTLSLTFALK